MLKKPCKNCPFRKDSLSGWLGAERMEEILSVGSFVCRKNIQLQCAGHMLIKGTNNDFVVLAERFGIKLNLEDRNLIFDDEQP